VHYEGGETTSGDKIRHAEVVRPRVWTKLRTVHGILVCPANEPNGREMDRRELQTSGASVVPYFVE